MKYRLDICYLGGGFQGWQKQPSKLSVQDHLESAIKTILREEVKTLGASRTDTGVHAEHQVVVFESEKSIDPYKFRRSLSALVPEGVGVLDCQVVHSDFHPILSNQGKVYRYRIWRGANPHPFLKGISWHFPSSIDVEIIRENLFQLLGKHDFKSFCASDSSAKTTVRTISEVKLIENSDLLEIWLCGNGFLKQMVRAIAGTLVEQASGQISDSMQTIIRKKSREAAGRTAPANGLSLVRLFYQEILPIDSLVNSQICGINLP